MSTEITVVNDIVEINVQEDVIVIEAPSGAYPLPAGVYSVYGRTGNVVAQDGDYNLTQLGDVTIASPATGQVLRYNGTTWVNSTESYIGTVTNVSALTIGTTGTDLSSTVVNSTTTPVITLNVPTASATNRGALSSTDWSTFNAKQPALNGLGFVKINGTTISYDNSSYYLASNPSSYIPLTALSSSATGLTYNNTTGVFSTTAGYGIPTTANQANWDSAYNDKINSAAVTGTTTKTLTLNQQDGGTITASWTDDNTDAVTSVFGRTGAVTAQSGDYNTLQVTENTNLYFTNQRARFAISGDATSGVVYSNTTGIIALDDIPNTSLFNDSVTINSKTVALGGSTTLTTTDIGEGTNLYFTTARAQAAISGTAPISVSGGVVSISQSGPSTNGYLSSADWNTFNAKQSALTLGNLTSSDITVTGGTGAVVGSGSTLTLATVNSNVGTFGSSTAIPVITVNGKGLVTAVTTDAVFIPSGALSFIGDVTGTGNTGSNTTLTLATVNSNVGAYGDLVTVPTITVNAKGLVTAASQTAIPTATSSVTGLLTSSDWSTFNNKQAQLNGTGFVKVSGTTVTYDNSTYLTTIEGIAAGGELSGTYASPSLVNSAVTGKVLTGVNITGGTIQATDSILTAFGKIQNQINGLVGGSIYQGTWNASTNTPTLTSGVGTKGYYYIVSVAGSTNLDGITDWNVGDWAIYDGTAWQQVDNTDAVVSVNGFTGAVSLTTSNIAEGTNEYFTTARARQSVSAGTGISYDNSTGVIANSAPDQTVSLTASTGISTSGTYPNFTITNTAPDQTVSLTSGTGINATGTYPNFTIANTAPDQTVSLTGAGGTSISGTYPNFTITSTVGTGTVTSVGITESGDALTITGSPITSSGTINIGFAGTGAQYIKGDGTLATFPNTIDQAKNLVTEVYNSTGATLTKGTVVYINGGQGNLPTVTKALASADNTSAQTYGVVQADITNNNNGFVVVLGSLNDIDTSAYATGTQLYLSGTVAGEWTSTKPYAPIHLVYVGIVVRSHPTQGVVEVRIQNGYEMDELHDVSAQNPNNGDILQYVSSTSLWTKTAGTTSAIAEGSNLYYTDARSRGAISLTTTGNNGASTYNSTTGVLNVPTYTLAGLGGINLTSLSATSPLLYDNTTGVFSIQQASGSQAGFLSAADWTTFNSKQGAITLTTTGSSGAATFSAGTLNIPNYTLSGLGGVPTSRTITINGTTQDLSANQTWTISSNVNATNTQDYTATAAQTTFTVTGGYTVGQLAVFYNGSKLASNEFTAINGTTFTLATACQANDIVQAVVSVTGGGIGGSGTTNYHSKWTASGVLGNSVIQDDGTNVGIGVAPNSSLSGYTFVTIGNAGSQFGGASANSFVSSNGYFNDGIWKYAVTGSFATLYEQLNGIHRFNYAQIGTAGNAITWNTGLTINTSGNVGIGTSTPSEKLDVIGGAVASGNGTIKTGITYSSLGLIGTFSNHNLGILTNGSEKIRITTAGNVGIGTTNPLFKLDVIGGIRVNEDGAGTKVIQIRSDFAGVDPAINVSTNNALLLQTNNTERMRIAANGTVLINSTTQSSAGIAATGTLQVYREILSAGVFAGLFWENRSGGVTSSSNWYGWYTTSGTIFLYNGSANAASINPSTGVYTPLSDKNKKKDFEASTIGLNAILGLKPTLYRMKDEDESVEKHLGFIAQEVKEFIPQAYIQTKGENEDFIGLDDRPIIAALVKAIQEQQKQIEELKQLVK